MKIVDLHDQCACLDVTNGGECTVISEWKSYTGLWGWRTLCRKENDLRVSRSPVPWVVFSVSWTSLNLVFLEGWPGFWGFLFVSRTIHQAIGTHSCHYSWLWPTAKRNIVQGRWWTFRNTGWPNKGIQNLIRHQFSTVLWIVSWQIIVFCLQGILRTFIGLGSKDVHVREARKDWRNNFDDLIWKIIILLCDVKYNVW